MRGRPCCRVQGVLGLWHLQKKCHFAKGATIREEAVHTCPSENDHYCCRAGESAANFVRILNFGGKKAGQFEKTLRASRITKIKGDNER